MTSQWIDIPAQEGGTFKGYLALPPTGKGPGLVLIQEIFGVNHHIQAVADQYALDGYVVLAPDLFWRTQVGVSLGYSDAEWAIAFDLMGQLDFDLAVQDLGITLKALRARSECTDKVASLGYCLGGLLSYLTAVNTDVDAAVCYYPGSIDSKLDLVGRVTCPILINFAEQDKYISPAAVAAVQAAFSSAKQAHIEVYPGVDHGFSCWERPVYNQTASALAHGKSLIFLAQNL